MIISKPYNLLQECLDANHSSLILLQSKYVSHQSSLYQNSWEVLLSLLLPYFISVPSQFFLLLYLKEYQRMKQEHSRDRMRFDAHNSVDRIRMCPSHSSCETQYLDNLCILPVQTSVSLHSRSYIRWASCLICSSFLILDACFAAFAIAGSSTGSLSLVPFLLVFRKLPDTPETKNRPARWSANLWLFGYRTPIGCSNTGRPSILDYYQDQSELLWWSHYEVSQYCLAHSHWSTATLMIPVRSMLSMQH